MPKKQQPSPEPTTPDQELEARVDAMMAVDRAEKPASKPKEQPKAEGDLPPLDIFSDSKTAPAVPDHLLEQIGGAEPAETEEPQAAEESIPAVELDDPTSDAAVDEIVEAEGDTVLDTEDAEAEVNTAETEPKRKPVHHHPIFWTIVFILAVLAVVVTYLLASGGNTAFPGTETIQRWLDK